MVPSAHLCKFLPLHVEKWHSPPPRRISVAYDTSTKHFLDFSMTPQEFHAEEAIFSQQVDKVLPCESHLALSPCCNLF
jgi:hypothetical protein